MEFSGVVEYNWIFVFNFLYGLLLSVMHLFIVNFFIRQRIVKYIVATYIGLFFSPIFVLNEWLADFQFLEVLAYVEIFFMAMILFYGFFLYVFKARPYQSGITVQTTKIIKGRFSLIKYFRLNTFFYIASVGFVFYFLQNLGFSGVYQYIYLQEIHPRFAWYESPESMQFLFAIYGRILAPVAIIYQKKNLSFVVVALLSALILVNSVERQTMIIILFALFVRLFFVELKFNQKIVNISMIMLTMLILFYIFIMQGNIESHTADQILFDSLSVMYNRIIVDPLYMLNHIIVNYNDMPYTYAATNRSIGYIFDVYIPGFSAIGILADGYLALGVFGVFLASFWYSMILAFCVLYLKKMKYVPNSYKIVAEMLILIAMISFFYSNIFSAIPVAVILVFIFYRNLIIRIYKC